MLSLVPGPDVLDLTLYDQQGRGLSFCAWRSLYETGEYELPQPSIFGGALLLRPDLFDKLLTHPRGHMTWREHLVGINIFAQSTPDRQ
jgi:hypothetical protein